MRRMQWLTAIAVAVGTVACASVRMSVEPRQGYDFSALHSFAVVAVEGVTNLLITDETHSRVRDAIASTLEAKGYTQVAAGEADFLVRVKPLVNEKVADAGRVGGIGGLGAASRESGEGGITIEMVDRKTGDVIWTGTAKSFLGAPQDAERVMIAATPKLLERFPPK